MKSPNETNRYNCETGETTAVALETGEAFITAHLTSALGDARAALQVAATLYDDLEYFETAVEAIHDASEEIADLVQQRLNREHLATMNGARIYRG